MRAEIPPLSSLSADGSHEARRTIRPQPFVGAINTEQRVPSH